jgi:hypothetical protein
MIEDACEHDIVTILVTIDYKLVIRCIAHLYNLLQHFRTHYQTQTCVLSLLQSPLAVAW